MKVYPVADFFSKTRNHRKISQKLPKNAKKTTIYWKTKGILNSLKGGEVRAPAPPRQLRHCCRPVLYPGAGARWFGAPSNLDFGAPIQVWMNRESCMGW